ncbi:MAG: hypothetical protein HN366_24965 [Deltaproteobacteria bacterium]|jgi:hypothetical protein|nr:hypothetical protein [Deltaproteobacteria bacterium]
MSVTLKLSPLLRKYVPGYDHDEGIVVENGAGEKVSRIAEELSIPRDRITMVIVNHRPSRIGYVAREGDLILLGMVIGGG